ncbi:YdbH domain-containing protein [Neptunomonas qingdaonensis]|uniref:Dicarboxylate transport n=1 Tax=Neptunomonas qingdaonensis TaxID=1045558 RepID=A0A1I2SZ54_9GAMM|nr:YdbH domain-containing protein [Neptunomonas qingdaonensis]SFG55221.1 Dicarboxylate transport [Neptunomonas qingdaonensis]
MKWGRIKLKRWLSLCLIVLVALPVLSYLSLPFIAKNVVEIWLTDQGFQKPVFSVEYPSHRELLISQLSVEKHTENRISTLSAGPVTIKFDPWKLLFNAELTRIEIPSANLDIAMTGKAPQDEAETTDTSDTSSFDLSQLMPDQWLELAPAQELVIGQLDVKWYGPDQPFYRFTGNIYLTQKQLLTRVLSSINERKLSHSDITLFRDNRFQINVIDQQASGSGPIVRLTGLFIQNDASITLQALHSVDLGKIYQIAQQLEIPQMEIIPPINGSYSGDTEISFAKDFTGNLDAWLLSINAIQQNQLQARIEQPYDGIDSINLDLTSELSLLQPGSLKHGSVNPGSVNSSSVNPAPLNHSISIVVSADSKVSLANLEQAGWSTANATATLDNALTIKIAEKTDIEPFKMTLNTGKVSNSTSQIIPQPISLSFSNTDLALKKTQVVFNAPQIQTHLNTTTLPAIQASGNIYVQLPEIKAGISLGSNALSLQSAISLAANLDKALIDAQWRIKEIDLAKTQAQWRPYLATLWPEKLTFISGEYSQSGHFKWLSGRLDGVISHFVSKISLTQDRLAVIGASIDSKTFLRGERIDEQGSLRIDKIDAGVEINDIQSQYRLNKLGTNNSIADISHFSGTLLGGSFQLAPFYSVLNPLTINTDLFLRGLSLDALLKLEQQPGLSGEGILDGDLPLRFTSSGIYITDGIVQARGPGIIRYRPDASIQALRQSYLGLGIALDALADFHYHELSVGANYTPDGVLLLKTHLAGNNPAWNNGQAVNFSLNIEENLLNLLKTLQFTDELTNTIEKRYRTP